MPCSNIWIAPHLRVLIADADRDYRHQLRTRLHKLGFRGVAEAATAPDTLEALGDDGYDIVMVEVAAPFQPVWDILEGNGAGATLVVGMSLDRSGQDWIGAIHQGANAILMKAFFTHLLQPVLAHMLASPAARRCRIVQFPRPEPLDLLDIRPSRLLECSDALDG